MEKPEDINEQSESSKIEEILSENVENDEKNSLESLASTVKTLQESVDDLREKQEKLLEILEKLEEPKKVKTVVIPPAITALVESVKAKLQGTLPTCGRKFVLKNVFKDVSSMKEGVRHFSQEEEHFGVPWKMSVFRKAEHLKLYFYCSKVRSGDWKIAASLDVKVLSSSGNGFSKSGYTCFGGSDEHGNGHGWKKFLKWDEMMKEYVIDDKLAVEIHVEIEYMIDVYKDDLRSFDVDTKKFSDVILDIDGNKFYVSKLYLARHSPYFEALFLGQFQESQKAEVSLSGIDPEDFQKFLEVLHGDPAIDEAAVEGILLVSDMYDTPIVIRKCEEFLMKESKKSMKTKLRMATRYNLDELKKKCLSDITTAAEI